ncbi:Protein of unknown function [Alteromonadaceae bacterium Bs31]|nr:Protein of unknown function [Alteromonadaceae bacterium Bs31]
MKITQGIWIPAFIALLVPMLAYAQQNEELLRVKPDRCIALRQGQYCYQKLEFSWATSGDQKFCLLSKGRVEPLVCWQGKKLTLFEYEFKSSQDQAFVLIELSSGKILDEVEVDVAWVYKSSKKVSTGWRLF